MASVLGLFLAYPFAPTLAQTVTPPPYVLNPELLDGASLSQKSKQLLDQGNYRAAEPLAQKALAIREKWLGPDHLEVAQSLNILAELYSELNKQPEARLLYQRALRIREQALGPNHPDVAQSLNYLAILAKEQGNFREAEPLYQKALTIREQTLGLNHPLVAQSLNNLANLSKSQGNFRAAEPLYQRALAIQEKALGIEHKFVGATLNNLGNLYREQGNFLEAEPLFRRTLTIWEKTLGLEHPNVATILNNLANLYADQGNYQQAEPLYQRALSIREKVLGSDHPLVGQSFNNLAALHLSQANYSAVEPFLQKALSIREKSLGIDHPDVSQSLGNLALLRLYQDNYQEAERYFKRALAIREKSLGLDHPSTSTILKELALTYSAQGRDKEAELYFKRALNIEEQSLAFSIVLGDDRRKRDFLSTFNVSTNQIISFHLQQAPNSPDALNLAFTTLLRRKGRVLEELSKGMYHLRATPTPEDQKLFNALTTTRTQLATLIFQGPQDYDMQSYPLQIRGLVKQLKEQESALASKNNSPKVNKPVTLKVLQKYLTQDAALLEFIRYQPYNLKAKEADRLGTPRYGAYLLLANGKISGFDLGLAAPIDEAIANLRLTLAKEFSPNVIAPVARKLDQLVMEQIRKKAPNTRRWLISLDSQLNLLPFAALVDEQGDYLLNKHIISYLGSGRDLLRIAEVTPAREAPLLVANPDFQMDQTSAVTSQVSNAALRSVDLKSLSFAPLPGTAAEVMALQKLLPQAKVLAGAAATEGAIKEARGPQILHIATHGFFLRDLPLASREATEHPLLRSGLVLSGFNTRLGGKGEDGALTALEASGLDLMGTQLVVLSACQTGLGQIANGEGVYGLQRAFTLAGAKSLVTSLWYVDDRATQQLMEWYYQNLLKGIDRSEALSRAQQRMLSSVNYSQPRYWAGFVPTGDWRPLGFFNQKPLYSPNTGARGR